MESVETLSTAASVREIVEREPDAGGLLPYIGTDIFLPPPADVAERVWGLLIQDIMPHTARARQQQLNASYGAVPYAEFQLMRAVAETCQIHDFCLADLRRASLARWLLQMQQVDAFLASRAASLNVYGAQFGAMRRLELEELRLAAAKADKLRSAFPLHAHGETQQQARARMQSAVAQLEILTEQLRAESAGLEAEQRSLRHEVDSLRSMLAAANAELAHIRRQMGELRPVLARGANVLESDLEAVEQRVGVVRRGLSEIHSRREALGFAHEALTAVNENVQRLTALKVQWQAVQEQEIALRTRVAPLQRRLDLLERDRKGSASTNRALEMQLEQLKSDADDAHALVEELTNRLKQAAAQLDALETRDKSFLEQLERDLEATTRQLQELEAVLHSRQQWLDDFRTAEAASTKLENELAVLRHWSVSQAR